MRHLIILSLLTVASLAQGQSFDSPVVAFNQAANEYIYDGTSRAVQTLNRALQQYPEDEKLKALLEKILKDKQQQQQENQEQKSEQQKEEQQQEEKESEEKKEDQQQQQDSEEKADEEKEAEEKQEQKNEGQESDDKEEQQDKKESDLNEIKKNLEEINISPERARMLLEAMKNNEIQYIQQMQRKPTQKPDSGKPDW